MKTLILALGLACPLISPPAVAESTDIEQVQSIIDQAKARDYLPLGYVYEATFFYHYYLAMEVRAASDVTLFVQYIDSKDALVKPALAAEGFSGWSYHAGLMLWPKDAVEPTIFDVIVDDKPMLRSQWRQALFVDSPDASVRLSFADSANLSYNGSIIASGQGPNRSEDLLAEFPNFNAGDVALVCKLVAQVIPVEPGITEAAAEAKLKAFRQRTYDLVQTLDKQGKLEGLEYVGDDLYGCAKAP